jgi:hypothetical protein
MLRFIRRPIEVEAEPGKPPNDTWEGAWWIVNPLAWFPNCVEDDRFRDEFAPADEEAAESLKTCGCGEGINIVPVNPPQYKCLHCGVLIAEGV